MTVYYQTPGMQNKSAVNWKKGELVDGSHLLPGSVLIKVVTPQGERYVSVLGANPYTDTLVASPADQECFFPDVDRPGVYLADRTGHGGDTYWVFTSQQKP